MLKISIIQSTTYNSKKTINYKNLMQPPPLSSEGFIKPN